MPIDPNSAPNEQCAVIIVAAGRGTRALGADYKSDGKSAIAKQYQKLDERCMLAHTLEVFIKHPKIDIIQVVIHEADQSQYDIALSEISDTEKLKPPVIGGQDRQQSVLNGLEALNAQQFNADSYVLIHDAARPFLDPNIIDKLLAETFFEQGVIPALKVVDTIKKSSDNTIIETVSREKLYAAQTPQSFVFKNILSAHRTAFTNQQHGLTDDADIAQSAGFEVAIINGSRENVKVTTFEDLTMAQEKMAGIPDIRVGQGYDSHVFDEASELYLCGVKVEHTHGLKGHSDADVGLHALTDALLGTIASGDIGSHFPPSDEKWKGANSQQFLTHAVELIKAQGGTINHVDVTLICEMPKIGPHRDKMRECMAGLLGIDMGRVSLKATTNEQMGFIGRAEGMAAMATATVIFGV